MYSPCASQRLRFVRKICAENLFDLKRVLSRNSNSLCRLETDTIIQHLLQKNEPSTFDKNNNRVLKIVIQKSSRKHMVAVEFVEARYNLGCLRQLNSSSTEFA